MSGFLHDLRHAARRLSKNPGFTAVAVLTMALGIGGTTAIYSVVRAVLLKPLGFAQPDRLVTLEEREKDGSPSNTSFATYVDWRARSRSFEEIAASSYWSPTLAGGGGRDAERLEGLRVTDGFFRLLGIQPALGRDFLPSEQQRGNHRVVILGHGLWMRRFGGDPAAVGRTTVISDAPYLVVGVLPADFESIFSPVAGRPTEIWAPLAYGAAEPWACRDCRHLRALGRIAPGVTPEAARAEMDAISRALVGEYPGSYAAAGVLVTPLSQKLTAGSRSALWALAAAVGLVLLIGCANVATLLFGRAAERRSEVAVRRALGASRGRLARLVIAEAVELSAAGGALGLAATSWLLTALKTSAPQLPRLAATRIDGSVLLFTIAASVATGLLFGAMPALSISREEPEPALREGAGRGASGRTRRVERLLVAFDVALALALLFGAGLLVKSMSRLMHADPGFRTERLLTMQVNLSGPASEKDPAILAFFDRVRAAVVGLPGVVSVGFVSQIPLGGDFDQCGIHAEDRPSANPAEDPDADRYAATPGYLSTMGIPIVRGRGILESDRSDALPVVLVNETLAKRVWRGENPLGKRVKVGGIEEPWRTVVGVVGDVRHVSLDSPRTSQVYVPHAQFAASGMTLVLRAAGDPGSLAAPVRAAIRSVDPSQLVTSVETMDRVIETGTATRRFFRNLLIAFAAMALLLAAVGIFGVVAGHVGRRTREIGIRLALGARRGAILRLVAGETIRLAVAGLALGLPAGLLLGTWLRSQLFAVQAGDAGVLLAGAATILAVVAVAAFLPARRAARMDPAAALRPE